MENIWFLRENGCSDGRAGSVGFFRLWETRQGKGNISVCEEQKAVCRRQEGGNMS